MIQLINDDCIEVMKEWPENYVDLIITSPPYEDISGAGYQANNYQQSCSVLFSIVVIVDVINHCCQQSSFQDSSSCKKIKKS